jgi:uncharacterized YccA/Bax inhibitor family protein
METKRIVALAGAFFGVVMMVNAILVKFQENSAIHQIYGVLEWGLGLQAVLISFMLMPKEDKRQRIPWKSQ